MSTLKTTDKAQASSNADTELKPAEKKPLYSVLTHLQDRIDFERVASDIEIPNAEAAEKKIATTIKGDQIGETGNDGNFMGDTKTPVGIQTKTKAAITPKELMDAGSARKKRKTTEMKGGGDGLVEAKG
ncbi:hypothetical protein EPUS_04140 [Endocarpon pusillum Z07020]|uniref:Myb-like DNA-binding domain-containing protein n=1 Tax=Endocarpon pusillum (strain Z07020 / HMAS-L-300199) TaxID=1263415 RepID=U1GUZ0_ENDPU|nr:uncharacterized protein EPUS_04140 [Endocarpon pusillum Z07020]ERF76283.1 hypothetical protein EPUS_04140 [Endocarpon pusillum Z07020]